MGMPIITSTSIMDTNMATAITGTATPCPTATAVS